MNDGVETASWFTRNKKAGAIICGVLAFCVALLIGGTIGSNLKKEEYQEAIDALAAIEAEEAAAAEAAAQEELDYWIAYDEAQAYMRTITINGVDVSIDLAAETHTWFDSDMMMTEFTNTFVFGDFSGYEVIFEGQPVEEGSVVEIDLDVLDQCIGLELQVTCEETGVMCYYYISTLHSIYNCVTTGEGEGDGYYYFNNENTLYKMDMQGNIVFYKVGDNITCDFKQNIADGKVYYSYIEYTQQGDDTVGATKYKGVVLNEYYEVIDTIDYLYTSEGMPENCSLDMHELIVLGENHYMFASYVYQMVDNVPTDLCEDGIAYVQATVLQEVKDGEILLQWESTDYPEFYAWSIRSGRYVESSEDLYIDYMHYNCTAIDPEDGNLVLSFRSLSALVKIDRETGDIIWVLGGDGDMFDLTEEQKMSYQHFPQYWDNDTITVYDNGTEYEQTRVIEYVLDEENLTLLECNIYQIDGWYASARGSAMRLSEDSATYLVGWGQAAANNVVFTEINFDTGEVIFEMKDYDSADNALASSYRVYKFDS